MVFELNGTPTKDTWPDVTNLADYNVAFPKFKGKDLTKVLPQLDDVGRDLFKNLICNAPGQRLSAKAAMHHPFFSSVNKQAAPPGEVCDCRRGVFRVVPSVQATKH